MGGGVCGSVTGVCDRPRVDSRPCELLLSAVLSLEGCRRWELGFPITVTIPVLLPCCLPIARGRSRSLGAAGGVVWRTNPSLVFLVLPALQ